MVSQGDVSTSKPEPAVSHGDVPTLKPEPLDNVVHLDEGGTDSLNSVDSGVITNVSESRSNNKMDSENIDQEMTHSNSGLKSNTENISPVHCERCAALRLLHRQPGDTWDSGLDLIGSLDTVDNSTGILHVWFLLLEGLASAVSSCPKSYQPETLEMFFELLKATSDVPGENWGNFLLLNNIIHVL